MHHSLYSTTTTLFVSPVYQFQFNSSIFKDMLLCLICCSLSEGPETHERRLRIVAGSVVCSVTAAVCYAL